MRAKNKSTASRPNKTPAASTQLSTMVRQNEQALLVILSYMIGFTTAFIAFNLSEDKHWLSEVALGDAGYSVLPDHTDIVIKENDLYVKREGLLRPISLFENINEPTDGFHYNIAVASVSPDGRFVHYCTEATAFSDACENFIYSVSQDVIYRVKNDEGQISSSVDADDNFDWNDDGLLLSGRYQSVSADEPWKAETR